MVIEQLQGLHQQFSSKLGERMDYGRTLASQIKGLSPAQDGRGYIRGDYRTVRITDSGQADKASSLLRESTNEEESPSHLFQMATKAVPAHLVYLDGKPVAMSAGYLGMGENNNLQIRITHEAGTSEALSVARSAIQADSYKSGFDVSGQEPKLSMAYSLLQEISILQAIQEGIFLPEKLGFLPQTDKLSFIGELPDGAKIMVRPPLASDYVAIEEIEIQGWERDRNDAALGNFLVRSPDLAKFNTPFNTMFVGEVDGRIVSFVFGFLGIKDRKPVLYSHMAATLPEYQSRGVMKMIKKAQLITASRLGCVEIRWTYDPALDLTRSNHFFNLNILGCVADKYYSDLYSPAVVGNSINAGLVSEKTPPSDRFEVVQDIIDTPFQKHILGEEKKRVYSIDFVRNLPLAQSGSDAPILKYPVRAEGQSKSKYILEMRQIFPTLFDCGYQVISVASDYNAQTRKVKEAWFILEKANH